MKRKLTIPAPLSKNISAQKRKIKTVLAKVDQFGKEFGSVESDALRFEEEAAALEMKADYADESALEKIDRLRRKARMARAKSENSGPIAEKINDALIKEVEAATPLILAALEIDREQVTAEIVARLLPYVSEAQNAKNIANHHTELGQRIFGSREKFTFRAASQIPPTVIAQNQVAAMEQILAGFSPVEFVSAAEADESEK